MYDFIIHAVAAIPVPCSLFPLIYPWRFRQHPNKSEFSYDSYGIFMAILLNTASQSEAKTPMFAPFVECPMRELRAF